MNKKFLMVLVSIASTLALLGCSKEEATVEPEVESQVAESTEEETTEEVAELSDDEKKTVLESYTDGLTMLNGEKFQMSIGNRGGEGLYTEIAGPSGTLYWMYPSNSTNLVTADYDGDKNSLTFNSVAVNNDKSTEVTSSVDLKDLIGMADDTKMLFSVYSSTDGKDVIMVESRSMAYTFADGVNYRLAIVEVSDDGSLNVLYDDHLAGSGDEDITETIRNGFNAASGKNYDQATFEDAFYNNNLLVEQEGYPILATITFKSDAAKLSDAGDWESASEKGEALWGDYESDVEPQPWGEGEFAN